MKLVILTLVCVAFIAYSAAEEFVCEKDVSYIENECNGCTCTENQELVCTMMGCIGPNLDKLNNCEVGTTWDKNCNKCWCLKDAGTICTDKKC